MGTACAKALSGREGGEFRAWMEVSEAGWRQGDWEAGEAGGEVLGQALLDQISHGGLFRFYLWTAGELPKGLGERLEQVSVESGSLCLLVRRGWWGRRHSRRLGRGCGKVQVGDGGVRRGCGVGERREMAGTLGDDAGGRRDAGSRQGVGGVEGDPQGSWWRAKAPRQSGLGKLVLGKVVVTEAVSLWSFPSTPSNCKRFLLVFFV